MAALTPDPFHPCYANGKRNAGIKLDWLLAMIQSHTKTLIMSWIYSTRYKQLDFPLRQMKLREVSV